MAPHSQWAPLRNRTPAEYRIYFCVILNLMKTGPGAELAFKLCARAHRTYGRIPLGNKGGDYEQHPLFMSSADSGSSEGDLVAYLDTPPVAGLVFLI